MVYPIEEVTLRVVHELERKYKLGIEPGHLGLKLNALSAKLLLIHTGLYYSPCLLL